MIPNYYRNIPLLYIYSVLIKRVSMPIIVIYFLLNNLNFTQIGILVAVTYIIQVSTEIHGGIFADLHGRKLSLLISSLFGFLTMLFYFIGDSFVYFFIASVMYGISGAFITGTRPSLLYSTLEKLNKTHNFKKYNGKMLFYSHLFNALVLLLIPVLYTYNVKLPFLIGMLFFIGSFITALFFIEPAKTEKQEKSFSTYNKRLSNSLKEIHANKKLLSTLFMIMATSAFVFMSSPFIQPLLQISGLAIIYFGVVYALMRAIMGLAGIITHKLERYFKTGSLLFIGLALITLSLFGFSYGFGLIIISSVLLLKFSEGLNRILLEDDVNKNIKSTNRTTILSISSLSKTLFASVLVFIFGITADLVGVQAMFVYVIVVFLVCAIPAFIFMKKNQQTI